MKKTLLGVLIFAVIVIFALLQIRLQDQKEIRVQEIVSTKTIKEVCEAHDANCITQEEFNALLGSSNKLSGTAKSGLRAGFRQIIKDVLRSLF